MKVRTISVNEKRGTAMVVIHQPDPSRKGVILSETRHLKGKGGFWTDTHGNKFVDRNGSFETAS
jgi:hypothetical protein